MTLQDYGPYREEEILPLYAAVGWTNYTRDPAMLRAAFARSLCVIGAYEGDKLVGLLRAVGDGCSVVLVQDLLVWPQYQRRGVGTALMKAILSRYAGVYQFQLLTDNTEKTAALYRSIGLAPVDEAGCRAFWRLGV